MAKIDLEKVLIALLDSPFNKQFDDKVKDALKEQGLKYKDGEIVEIQKPKFHEGDWVINRTDATIMQIINNTDFYESIEIGGQRRTDTYNYVEWDFRLWTIEDAKDGDVLVDVYGNIGIFEKHDDFDWTSYCSLGVRGGFQSFKVEHENGNACPATNAQRHTLFAKMKEAGYTFAFDKKELKPIDNRFDYEHANIQQKDFAPKATAANRQLYNRAILKLLSDYVEKYPDIRFGQMLYNLSVNPHFDKESRETYWNLSKTINKKS